MAEYHLFNVLVIGHNNSGKTSLISRYIDNLFKESYTPTSGVVSRAKKTEYNGCQVKLQIWDTPGHESLQPITNSFYRGCHGIIIVFDVTDRNSYEKIFDLFRDSERYGPKGVSTLLVGNKCDLTVVRCVTDEEARDEAAFFNMNYIDTSADKGTNVSKAFEILCEKMYATVSKRVAKKSKPSETQSKCDDSSIQQKNTGVKHRGGDSPEYVTKIFNQMREITEKLKVIDKLNSVSETLGIRIEELETKVNRLEAKRNATESETSVNKIEKRKIHFKTAHSRSFRN